MLVGDRVAPKINVGALGTLTHKYQSLTLRIALLWHDFCANLDVVVRYESMKSTVITHHCCAFGDLDSLRLIDP